MADVDPVVACPSCGKRNRIPAAARGTPRCAVCRHALPWLVEADDVTFVAAADRSRLPVLVDLWAPWCGPCRFVSPAVERLASEFAGRLKVVKVNVDVARRTAQRFNAMSIPTLLLLREGQEVARQVGAVPEQTLREWLRPHVADTGSGAPPTGG